MDGAGQSPGRAARINHLNCKGFMDTSEFISLDLYKHEMVTLNVKKYYDIETYQDSALCYGVCVTHLLGIIFKSSGQNVQCVRFRSI